MATRLKFFMKLSTRMGPRIPVGPYFLKVFKQRWYLVGLASPQNKQYIFALDRIRGLKPVDKKFTFPEGESVDNYFLYNYGVMFPPDFKESGKCTQGRRPQQQT